MEELALASTPKRLLAGIIDLAIVSLPTYAASFVTRDSSWMLFLIFLGLTCCYYTYMPTSVGQKIMRIRTVMRDGTGIKSGVIFNRTVSQFLCPTLAIILMQSLNIVDEGVAILSAIFLLQAAVLLLWSYWYAIALFSKRRQTFHDVIYNTVVLDEKAKKP
ncbi:RDD family protein [Anaplasma capra]|uniref:RDD family protein n=1 Tax=Anaplasma capra TaxID=1562740 RepID=UPI0021D5AB12|nr:RDD family protein [Anaplasma capra]MCU7611695.1 RDD family protein [Anaplasma capra]MCU7612555.1 RDD family protein [Anaplasma capra]